MKRQSAHNSDIQSQAACLSLLRTGGDPHLPQLLLQLSSLIFLLGVCLSQELTHLFCIVSGTPGIALSKLIHSAKALQRADLAQVSVSAFSERGIYVVATKLP